MVTVRVSRDVTGSSVESLRSKRGRFAAIVDLENVAISHDGHVSQLQMQVLLSAIGADVSGMPVRVATGINTLRAYTDLISLQHWGLTLVKTEPDAADKALCEAALDFIRCGGTDIIVVSGDHSFIPLAAHANLHVISHADHLSKALHFAATTVKYLPDLRTEVRAAS